MPIKDPDEEREYKRLWAKSLKQYPKRLYKGLEKRARLKNLSLTFTRNQLDRWLHSSTNYVELHATWEESNFQQRLAPAVVIIDSERNYTLDNIELVPFHIASTRGGSTQKSKEQLEIYRDKLSNRVQCIETGEIFNSQAEAARKLNLPKDGLRKYFKGVQRTVGGLTFRKV